MLYGLPIGPFCIPKFEFVWSFFQQAADYLSPLMKNTDGLLRLHAYWARLELKLGNDFTAARGVWESLLKTWFDYSRLA